MNYKKIDLLDRINAYTSLYLYFPYVLKRYLIYKNK